MGAPDDAVARLRRHRLRVTPQRRAILESFRGTVDEHLSAEEVLSRASVAVPAIGRGTVYAALNELTELGLLSSVGHAESIRYETNVRAHDHFHCRVCLRMFDVDLGGAEMPADRPAGYRVESVAVRADGVCPVCRSAGRTLVAEAPG